MEFLKRLKIKLYVSTKEKRFMIMKRITGKAFKLTGVILGILGIAFYCGSGLAYLQGVLTQIAVMAATGTISLVAGVIFYLVGRNKCQNK